MKDTNLMYLFLFLAKHNLLDRFVENVGIQNSNWGCVYDANESVEVCELVLSAFTWRSSKEGSDFWYTVYKQLMSKNSVFKRWNHEKLT